MPLSLSTEMLVVAALLWVGLLFAVAVWGERRISPEGVPWPLVYALSLAVHCTAWTFYGTVTQAARSGWIIPPTFLGIILLFVVGWRFMARLVVLAKEHRSTSIADLIATRFGKSSMLAALITAVALLGIVPYIALQLKAVAMSFSLLTRAESSDPVPAWQDVALYVAVAMAVFAMLFGTRRASASEHNPGLVLAIAFEAVFKLMAMLVVGGLVIVLFAGVEWSAPSLARTQDAPGLAAFATFTLLGALAMFTLPHQFQIGVVECREPGHVRQARWLFPLFLVLIALPVLPLARIGMAHFSGRGVPTDLYILALPLDAGQEGLALLAFLGGLSAATGMVIMASLTLSVMVVNHWITPSLVRLGRWRAEQGSDLRGRLVMQRRLGIAAILLLAFGYSRGLEAYSALADIGGLSFSGLAHLAPAVLLAVYRPHLPPAAVAAGIIGGTLLWAYLLLLPGLAGDAPSWLDAPFGLTWLSPGAFLGTGGWDALTRGVVLSLGFNLVFTGVMTRRLTATANVPGAAEGGALTPEVLRPVAGRFLAPETVERLFADREADPLVLAQRVENELSGIIGSASTRLLLDAARTGARSQLETVATIVGEASQALKFNQQVLEAALANMTQGISVIDARLRLVAWNQPYLDLFDYPPELVRIGVPVAGLIRHNVRQGLCGSGDEDTHVKKRLAHMGAGTRHVIERRWPNGRVLEIRGNPMPGGGFVTTFSDVTEFRRVQDELRRINETLEQRVRARTAELETAKLEAERANEAKSRFLAAVSHDLVQPLNAAHLFTHALSQQLRHDRYRQAVDDIEGALTSTESLLDSLLDISRLDAGGLRPNPKSFPIAQLIDQLENEFDMLARERGLKLEVVGTGLWVHSDPALLRRILQNFLSNALRYTRTGRVLLGCRRRSGELEIQVWDTGPGIADEDQAGIFEEFRRFAPSGGHAEPGLGLGLAIAERIARLLDHPLDVRSRMGRGTVFSVRVPRTTARPKPASVPGETETPRSTVLVVDNDPAVLRALASLLGGWHCRVLTAESAASAACMVERMVPDLLLLDYHLDGNTTGLEVRTRLRAAGIEAPALVITADHGDEVVEAVYAAGCELLHKPVKPLALKSLMSRLLTAGRAARRS